MELFELPAIFSEEYFGNTLEQYAIALGIFVGIFLLSWMIKKLLVVRLRSLFGRTKTRFDDRFVTMIDSIGILTYLAVALYASVSTLVVPEIVSSVAWTILLIAVMYELVRVLQHFAEYLIMRKLVKNSEDEGKQIVSMLKPIINIILIALAVLMVLSNMGINVTSLIASLGIGGIAVALAAQNILGDIFNSFSIYLDKPFKVGDFIIVDPHMGTVKRIGLKTTRIQALSGEELVIPNQQLTSSRIQNFKKMDKRRAVFSFGVTYSTTSEQLKKVQELVKKIITKIEETDFDRAHFKEFGDSSLNFEVVYFVKSGDYNLYMDLQQQINLELHDGLQAMGVEMAFPTRTVYMAKEEE